MAIIDSQPRCSNRSEDMGLNSLHCNKNNEVVKFLPPPLQLAVSFSEA